MGGHHLRRQMGRGRTHYLGMDLHLASVRAHGLFHPIALHSIALSLGRSVLKNV